MVDPKIKARALHRTKIIKGQLEAFIRAIESESYCQSLLIQSLSIQRSLKSLDHLLLESHLKIHVTEQMQKKSEQKKAVKELLEVFTMSQKT